MTNTVTALKMHFLNYNTSPTHCMECIWNLRTVNQDLIVHMEAVLSYINTATLQLSIRYYHPWHPGHPGDNLGIPPTICSWIKVFLKNQPDSQTLPPPLLHTRVCTELAALPSTPMTADLPTPALGLQTTDGGGSIPSPSWPPWYLLSVLECLLRAWIPR